MMSDQNNIDKLKTLLDIEQKKLGELSQAKDVLDQKSGVFLGFIGVILTILFSFNCFCLSVFNILGCLSLIGAICLLIYLILPKGYSSSGAKLEKMQEHYEQESTITFYKYLIGTCARAYKKNKPNADHYILVFRWGVGLMILGILLLISSII